MRKFILPLLLVLLALPAWAQASILTFSSSRGEPFHVKLDGKTINYTASNFVRVANLRPGKHYVEFKLMSRRGVYRLGANVFVPAGVEANYALHTAGRGKLYLRLISEIPLAPPPIVVPPLPRYPDRHEDRYEPAPPYDNHQDNACRDLMNKYDVDRLLESIRSRDFESSKLTIAREAIRSGSILAEDLKHVLEVFEYESTRVELAKFAYDYVCDKERFYYVYDVFKFDSSIRELSEYVNRRR